jgi:citrate lyase gamma subunit
MYSAENINSDLLVAVEPIEAQISIHIHIALQEQIGKNKKENLVYELWKGASSACYN